MFKQVLAMKRSRHECNKNIAGNADNARKILPIWKKVFDISNLKPLQINCLGREVELGTNFGDIR